jgi:hypothetical protein
MAARKAAGGTKTKVATVVVEEINETTAEVGTLITKGKRKRVNREDVTALLNTLTTARSAERDAHLVAEEARQAIIEIAGDAEILTDRYGVVLCRVPESSRRTIPIGNTFVAIDELDPEIQEWVREWVEGLITTSWFRRVTR